ncbi:mRNA-decapping enzyme 1B [Sparganum proliferum]
MMYKTARGAIFSVWFFSPEDCVRIGNLLNRLRLHKPTHDPPNFPPLRSLSVSQDPSKPMQSSPTDDTAIASVSDSFSKLVSIIRQDKEVDTIPAFSVSQKSKQSSAKECHEEASPPADSSIIDMLSTAAADFKRKSQNGTESKQDQSTNPLLKELKSIQFSPAERGAADLKLLDKLSGLYGAVKPKAEPPAKCQFYVSDLEQGLLRSEMDESLSASTSDTQCPQNTAKSPGANKVAETCGGIWPKQNEHTGEPTKLRYKSPAADSERLLTGERRTDGAARLNHVTSNSAAGESDAGYLEDNDDYDEEDAVGTPSRVSVFPTKSPHPPFSPSTVLSSMGASHVSKKSQHHHQPSGDMEGLTKAQLKTALLYLLENDEEFLTSIHNGYLRCLNTRINRR